MSAQRRFAGAPTRAGLPLLTHQAGGTVAILTQGPTPLDGLADVRLDGDVVVELDALVDTLEIG